MQIPDIQPLEIEQLEELIKTAKSLIETKRKEKREDAIGRALKILDEAGVDHREIGKVRRTMPTKTRAALKGGEKYVNPNDPKQVWMSGRGRRPKWLNELEAKGKMPKPE